MCLPMCLSASALCLLVCYLLLIDDDNLLMQDLCMQVRLCASHARACVRLRWESSSGIGVYFMNV